MFGTSPEMCARLWHMLNQFASMPNGVHPNHLLWALMLLKLYCAESVVTDNDCIDCKTCCCLLRCGKQCLWKHYLFLPREFIQSLKFVQSLFEQKFELFLAKLFWRNKLWRNFEESSIFLLIFYMTFLKPLKLTK